MSSLPSDANHGDDEDAKMPSLPALASDGAPSDMVDVSDGSGWNNLRDDNKLIMYVQDLSSLEAELKDATDILHASKLEQCMGLCKAWIAFINNSGAGKPIYF